jgi:histidyl-tRNA synthetase
MFDVLKLPKDKRKYLITLIDKSQYESVLYALQDFGIKKEDADVFLDVLQTSDIKKISNYIKEEEKSKRELSNLEKIFELLETSFNVKKYQLKMSIVRGLDYYKGIVFEIEAPSLGAEKQLCGGGAYELISLFGGRESSTAGFAIGFDRTIIALETEEYQFPTPKVDVYVIPVNEDMTIKSLEIVKKLRNQNISTDIDLLKRGIGKSIKYASSIDAEKVIILGPKEFEQNSMTVRDMKSGEQKLVNINDYPPEIKRI